MAAISCTKGDLIVVWLLSEVLWDLKVSLEFENWKCCRCRRLEPACKTRPFFARRSAWIVSSAAASPSCNFQVIFALKHNWYEWSYCSVPLFIYLCFSRIGLALDTDKHTFLFSCSILLTAVPHLVAFFSSKLAYVQQCRVCRWWHCDLSLVEIHGRLLGPSCECIVFAPSRHVTTMYPVTIWIKQLFFFSKSCYFNNWYLESVGFCDYGSYCRLRDLIPASILSARFLWNKGRSAEPLLVEQQRNMTMLDTTINVNEWLSICVWSIVLLSLWQTYCKCDKSKDKNSGNGLIKIPSLVWCILANLGHILYLSFFWY